MCSFLFSLLSGAVGALIGTYGGVYFSFNKQEKSKRLSRTMAVKAIDIFKKYSKKNGTFDQANQEFNNSFSLAEKRAILVALHKLGIPIIVSPERGFVITEVCFDKAIIDKEELQAIREQIEKGFCDQLFYLDPDTYFNENIRIATIRSIAKRWTRDVLLRSSFDFETKAVHYPDDWLTQYSWGEKLVLAVFKMRVVTNEYFDADGKPLLQKIEQLVQEIDRGLWDNCLCWDIETYQNLQTASALNTQLSNMLQSNLMVVGERNK